MNINILSRPPQKKKNTGYATDIDNRFPNEICSIWTAICTGWYKLFDQTYYCDMCHTKTVIIKHFVSLHGFSSILKVK